MYTKEISLKSDINYQKNLHVQGTFATQEAGYKMKDLGVEEYQKRLEADRRRVAAAKADCQRAAAAARGCGFLLQIHKDYKPLTNLD